MECSRDILLQKFYVITKFDIQFNLIFNDELGKAFRRINGDCDGKCVPLWNFPLLICL
jgi:hypothetical protein